MVNFKIRFISIFVIITLIFCLYISINNISLNLEKIYAAVASSTSTKTPNNGSDMTSLLARLVNGEARGEPYSGQVAVAAVVLNRVKSPSFPNTISRSNISKKSIFLC
jgi:hypothetical protein